MVTFRCLVTFCLCAVILLCNKIASIAAGELNFNVPGTTVRYQSGTLIQSPSEAAVSVDYSGGTIACRVPDLETNAYVRVAFDRPYTVRYYQ